GKVLKGIDIRKHGSGNVGATNIFRTVGKIPGIIVLLIDAFKGIFVVTFLPGFICQLFPEVQITSLSSFYIFFGAAAIAGHIWTCFLGFKGGKGVATTAGVMGGLSPVIFGVAICVWIIVLSLCKYVSVASITAAVTLPICAVLMGKDIRFIVFMGLLSLVGVYSHRANIRRLIQGSENKIIKSSKSQP
ncbi:MAG: glycerol-3-phosphate 1-O-acyltransferase PlsY, partial [Candidatus Omnitrophica bacterium]|nr:glycerol-3-phosphate 1-O-acyltransferase PlsY [Candidatus Omnitrophota bacterium]